MNGVDYTPDIRKRIILIPPGEVMENWRDDYKDMQSSMIYGENPSFEELMKKMEELEKKLKEKRIKNPYMKIVSPER